MSDELVEVIKKALSDIQKNPPESEHLLESYIDMLVKEHIKISPETKIELSQLDNDLITAIISYIEWQNSGQKDFNKITIFFAKLDLAIKQFYHLDIICSHLFKLLVEKRIQFKLLYELENELTNNVGYLDIMGEKLYIVQHRFLCSYSNAFIILTKNGRLEKNRIIGEKVLATCQMLSDVYVQTNRFDLQRNLLAIKVDINKILLIEEEKNIRLVIAESFENEGDNFESNHSGYGLTSYANAFMAFLDLGNKERLEKIKIKLKHSCEETKKSFKSIKIGTFSISPENWLKTLIPLIKYHDVLSSIMNLWILYPTFKVLDNQEIGVSIRIIPFVVIDNENNVSAILDWSKEPEECIKYQSYKQFKLEETTLAFVRSMLFEYLTENNLLEIGDFENLLNSSPINDRQKESLKFGITKYFSKDFISASYVLTLQIEQLIVILARIKGNTIAINRKQNRQGATQETTLGILLGNENVKKLFSKDFYNLLQLYFTYDLGFNYRNSIAHGLINHNKLNREYSTTLLIVICKILFMLKS